MCMCMCMRVQGGQDFLDQEGDLCGTWAENFFLAQVFTGLAAGCVAIVNVLLKIILTRTCGGYVVVFGSPPRLTTWHMQAWCCLNAITP